MILVDSRIGSKELLPVIQRIGVKTELTQLEYGDVCFEGNGPKGKMAIGIERKKLHDLLHCIDDARYAAHQRPGMMALYDRSFLIVEGVWSVGTPPFQDGILIESNTGGCTWGPCRYRTQRVMYSKLYRYLLSVAMSGVIITFSRDIHQTAYNICETFRWFEKPWAKHTSMVETQKIAIPSLSGKPNLVRRWAAELDGIGVEYSQEAERMFRTPYKLATADVSQWLKIKGIGVATAQKIIRSIQGIRD